MKKIKWIVIFIVLLITSINLVNITNWYYSNKNLWNFKEKVIKIDNGQKIVNKIDMMVARIIKKKSINQEIPKQVLQKINVVRNKINANKSEKSIKLLVILDYFHAKLLLETKQYNKWALKRIVIKNNKISSQKAKDRLNKIKNKAFLDRYKWKKKRNIY